MPGEAPQPPCRPPSRWPVLTLAVAAVTAAISIAGLLDPSVQESLARRPAALAGGEVWRLVGSLLVQDGGWPGLAVNTAFLIAIGAPLERSWGRAAFAILYLAGGLLGQGFGLAWQPEGAGNSVAVAALAGAALADRCRPAPDLPFFPAALGAALFPAALLGQAAGGVAGAGTLSIAVSALAGARGTLRHRWRWDRLIGLAGLACALGLTALRDIHGPPVLLGALLLAGRRVLR